MHRVKLVLAGLLLASPAFAEDTEMMATGGTSAGGEGAAEGGSLVGKRYVVNEGQLGFYAAYEVERATVGMAGMAATTELDDGFLIGAAYGVTHELTVGAQYGFRPGILSDAQSELSGPLGAYAMYEVLNDGTLNLTVTGEFIYDLCGTADMTGACVGTKALAAGAGVKYLLSHELALFTGAPIGPAPVGEQFKVSLEDMGKMSFDLPVGVMYQATPELGVWLSTNLMHIGIANDENAYFGADMIPLVLGASYELDKSMEIEAELKLPDVKNGIDELGFALGFRYYN